VDASDAVKALKTLAVMKRKKKSIKEKAYGVEAESGPKLRRIAYKVIRMKYEDQKDELETKMREAMTILQTVTKGESVDQIIAGFKEQKDITLFLEDARGKLEARQAQLIKQREDLQAKRDALVAKYSQEITDYDEEGREKHKQIEKWTRMESDGEAVKETAGRLIKEIHCGLRSINYDLMTKDVQPIRLRKKDPKISVKNNSTPAPVSSDSLIHMRKSLALLNDVDDSSPTGSTDSDHPTLLLARKVKEQMDDLMKRQAGVPSATLKSVSGKFGFETEEKKLIHGYQKYAENAIYANPRISWEKKQSVILKADLDDDVISADIRDQPEDKEEDLVMDAKDMKEYSARVMEEYRLKRFEKVEAAKPKGNWHKYC